MLLMMYNVAQPRAQRCGHNWPVLEACSHVTGDIPREDHKLQTETRHIYQVLNALWVMGNS